MTYFLCKAKYYKINELGKNVKVSEPYLVDAVTFIEAETRINKELEPYITGDFAVVEVKISNIESVTEIGTGFFYKVKISLIAYNEETGKEKTKNIYQLIQAENVKQAYEITEILFADSVSNFEILGIDKTPILDIFKHEGGITEVEFEEIKE